MPGALQPGDRVGERLVAGHRQAEGLGEFPVALVVGGDRHDGPGAVAAQHVVGQVHRDRLAGGRVRGVAPGEYAGLAGHPLPVADRRGALPVGPHGVGPIAGRQPLGQRMLRCQDHERGAGQRIRPGGERVDDQPVPRSALPRPPTPNHREHDHGALAAADPVPLLQLDRLRPVQVVQVGQQPVGVRGDPQHPLPQRPAVDREVADVAAPVGGDLLVGQHRARPGAQFTSSSAT